MITPLVNLLFIRAHPFPLDKYHLPKRWFSIITQARQINWKTVNHFFKFQKLNPVRKNLQNLSCQGMVFSFPTLITLQNINQRVKLFLFFNIKINFTFNQYWIALSLKIRLLNFKNILSKLLSYKNINKPLFLLQAVLQNHRKNQKHLRRTLPTKLQLLSFSQRVKSTLFNPRNTQLTCPHPR